MVLAVRNQAKGHAALDEITQAMPGAQLELGIIDLADLDSVRAFADAELASDKPLDVLVNNAGVMTPPSRQTRRQGHELQWGSNFLGPFALTNLLLPKLLRSHQARVVTMSSGMAAFGRINLADLDWERHYSSAGAYSQSKLGNLLMALHLARVAEQRGWSLMSTSAHPGYTKTNLQTAGAALGGGRRTMMSRVTTQVNVLPSMQPDEGAGPLLFAATSPQARNGGYYGPREKFSLVGPPMEQKPYRSAQGPTLAASTWAIAAALTGTDLPAGARPSRHAVSLA